MSIGEGGEEDEPAKVVDRLGRAVVVRERVEEAGPASSSDQVNTLLSWTINT